VPESFKLGERTPAISNLAAWALDGSNEEVGSSVHIR